MKRFAFFFLAASLLAACGGETSSDNSSSGIAHEKLKPEGVLEEFEDCRENATEKYACKEFTAKAICGTYGIGDFIKEESPRTYLPIDEIAGRIAASANWRTLGDADDQEVLSEAQELANNGTAVVAISTQEGIGNVAWILPGKQARSNSWGLDCPNSASFFMAGNDYGYVGKTLNYAWRGPDDIVLYARK